VGSEEIAMRVRSLRGAFVLGLALCALAATPAYASGGGSTGGGSSSGGGGSAGGGTPPPDAGTKSSACITINNFSTITDQSVVTAGASLAAAATVSRCGGSTPSFRVQLSAVSPTGTDILGQTLTWTPTKSLPFSIQQGSESASLATTYQVAIRVIDPTTGAVVASSTAAIPTPARRLPICATIANQGGTAGYYPGSTTAGALWVNYSVHNCGGREQVDAVLYVTDGTGTQIASYPSSPVVSANGSTGIGQLDIEPVPTGGTYHVYVKVYRHDDGDLLDASEIDLDTPVAT
jgi:hypothetical protein